jgi:hypothetical protein
MQELNRNAWLVTDDEVDPVHDRVFIAGLVPRWLSRHLVGQAMTLAKMARKSGGLDLARTLWSTMADQAPQFASMTAEERESWAAVKSRLMAEVFSPDKP